MADLYGREQATIRLPLTADRGTINWGGKMVTSATNIQISYAQQVQRRRTIGNKDAVIFGSMPQGQINIARLMADNASDLFSLKGWKVCEPTTVTVNFAGCGSGSLSLTATGCVVSNYSLTAEAEGLTVMDNVVIDFLQLANK